MTIDLDRFNYTKNTKKGATISDFCNGDEWVPLTKQTDEFLAPRTLRNGVGGLYAMQSFKSCK